LSLDLRIPMGLMFTIVGAILAIYGAVTRGSDLYQRSAGMNINLIWGVVMLVFGLTMFLLGRYSDTHPKEPSHEPAENPTERPRVPGH
jgi:multisubunit Na+/H+ antiporter MnhG subunit